jgi:hypothetical protein
MSVLVRFLKPLDLLAPMPLPSALTRRSIGVPSMSGASEPPFQAMGAEKAMKSGGTST